MLTIYSKDTTSFSTLGLGVLKDFISAPLISEELNGIYNLEFKYAKDGYLNEYLVEQNIIKANGQPFRIWNVKKDMQGITILAKHIFFDLSFNYLVNVAPTGLTAQSALNWLLQRTDTVNSYTVNGDCTEIASARYIRKNVTDAIFNDENALIKKYKCELSYDNYSIFCHQKRGQNANFSIRYRKNLTGLDLNLDFSSTATRIVPLGYDGLMIPEIYVDSDKINNYFTPLYKTVEFSNIKYDPNDEEAYQTLEEAEQALRDAANKLFEQGIDIPSVSIKIDFVELSKCIEYKDYSNLESVHLGDTIKIIIPDLNLNLETRIIKTTYDCILNRITSLEMGSVMPSSVTNQIQVNNEVKSISKSSILSEAQESAKNLINHPFNGNILIDRGTGVIYLMDSVNPSEAQNVWKWSLGGLGFSNNGINGDYSVAILQDGSINADFITSGAIDVNLIVGLSEIIANQQVQIDILNEKEPTSVRTAKGYTFDDEGLKISSEGEPYNALHNNIGDFYRDGETIVGQTTKDGSKFKDMDLFGTYRYGKNSIDDEPMFIAQLYTDANDEECFGHFYNGDQL